MVRGGGNNNMVASYETGSLIRSLVRVTGSGNKPSSNHLDPCILDLSNISSFAATVPISTIVPAALLNRRGQAPIPSKTTTTTAAVAAATTTTTTTTTVAATTPPTTVVVVTKKRKIEEEEKESPPPKRRVNKIIIIKIVEN